MKKKDGGRIQKKMGAWQMFGENTTNEINL
jgi:hypothetical protein